MTSRMAGGRYSLTVMLLSVIETEI